MINNNISNDCAKQLEKETGIIWDKGSYKLALNEAPQLDCWL